MLAPVELEGAGAWRQLGGSRRGGLDGRGARHLWPNRSPGQTLSVKKKKKKKGKEMKRDPDNSPGLARLPAGEATNAQPLPPLKPERREGDPLT